MDPKLKPNTESEALFEELKKDLTDTQKVIINKIVQGRKILLNYTIKDAVTELDDLFDG